jgi:hypothetical protein
VKDWLPFRKFGARDIPAATDIFEKNFRVKENPPEARQGMNGPFRTSGGLLRVVDERRTEDAHSLLPVGKQQQKPTGRLS